MPMKLLAKFALLALLPLPVHGAVEPGSHLVLRAQLLGCDHRRYIVDYAEVSERGDISVLDGIEIPVAGLVEEEIAERLANAVGERTGRAPKTLTVELVSPRELKRVARELMHLALSGQTCIRTPEQAPPDVEFIRSLAHAAPGDLHVSQNVRRLG